MFARLLPLLILVAFAPTGQAQQPDEPDLIQVVEDPPELIGGLEGLQRAIEYPAEAKAHGVQGTVFVQFVVDEEGNVIDEHIVRSAGPALDAEALRVARQARFEPGTQRGEPVKVQFTIPVLFKLGADRSER